MHRINWCKLVNQGLNDHLPLEVGACKGFKEIAEASRKLKLLFRRKAALGSKLWVYGYCTSPVYEAATDLAQV